jgi:hypothetical protein
MGTEYLAVHPFADETDLLKQISWSADRCTEVDAYWQVFDDIVFVQLISTIEEKDRPPGRYVRSGHGLNLLIVVSSPTITKGVFEDALRAILKDNAVARALTELGTLGPTLVPLSG